MYTIRYYTIINGYYDITDLLLLNVIDNLIEII